MKKFKVGTIVHFKKYEGNYSFNNKKEARGKITSVGADGYLGIVINNDDGYIKDNPYCFTPVEAQTLVRVNKKKEKKNERNN